MVKEKLLSEMFGDARMNNDIKKVLTDFFDAWDLVDLLEISTKDIIDAFEDMIEDRLDEILDHVGYNPDIEEEDEVSE
jgi:hypothetical protein